MRIPSLFGRHTVSFSTPDRNLQVVTHKLVPSVYSLNGYRPHNPYSPMVVLFPFSTENRKNGPYQLNIQNFLPWRGPLVTLLNSYDVTETAKFYRDCGRLHDTYLIITENENLTPCRDALLDYVFDTRYRRHRLLSFLREFGSRDVGIVAGWHDRYYGKQVDGLIADLKRHGMNGEVRSEAPVLL
ncbi:MAG TPA: hypothetical protein VJK03_04980 [Candidatus Nanoarchaeia archaeon]|nr:hypothetical protein [Candidatus Nanoarchaeia archaeon]